jgi:hypothetical protein
VQKANGAPCINSMANNASFVSARPAPFRHDLDSTPLGRLGEKKVALEKSAGEGDSQALGGGVHPFCLFALKLFA